LPQNAARFAEPDDSHSHDRFDCSVDCHDETPRKYVSDS
jgi:hypothetical protein